MLNDFTHRGASPAVNCFSEEQSHKVCGYPAAARYVVDGCEPGIRVRVRPELQA